MVLSEPRPRLMAAVKYHCFLLLMGKHCFTLRITSHCNSTSSTYRQNVVIVGQIGLADPARFATSLELLYLLNLLYNMPSECCDIIQLIQLYQKSSVWCFASHAQSTFELISSVASALSGGTLVTIGGETALSHAEQ